MTEPALPVNHGTTLNLDCEEGYTNQGEDTSATCLYGLVVPTNGSATCLYGQVVPTDGVPDCRREFVSLLEVQIQRRH